MQITWKNSVFQGREGESVLETLIRGGADIAFSCRKGSCQVCMMRCASGAPTEVSTTRLRPELQDSGHFLPCLCVPTEDLVIESPDLSVLSLEALVAEREMVRPHILRLRLEPERTIEWHPGQYLRVGDGINARSYSISSVQAEDYFVELHVQVRDGGAVSPWLKSRAVNDTVRIEGPLGDCHWREEWKTRPLIVIATGTGIPAMWGLVRDALRGGQSKILFFAGVRDADDLWLSDEIARHQNADFTFVPCVSNGRVTERAEVVAFKTMSDCEGATLVLCGNPGMVQNARSLGVLAGISREDIFADPFDDASPFWPNDREVYDALGPYEDLWEALGEGVVLRAVLEDFYDEAFEDPELAPYFHNVTKERAISKQYEFLAAMFRGDHAYFGALPFNAHHWMIISDALFDYREKMFERHLRAHHVCENHIRLWGSLHEKFRREIVKSQPRGLIWGDTELAHSGFQREVIMVATVCDGCQAEMGEGTHGMMHVRTGELFCDACGAT